MPAHFDAEVYGALRRRQRMGDLRSPQIDRIVAALATFPAERVALPALLPVAHGFGDRFSAPDAFYVALASVRRGELATADRGLARAAAGAVPVRLVGEEPAPEAIP